MASVGIRDVKKAFGATQVIHGVDIAIGDGEFVVLVGPSGCGKSTLLRMIAGLEHITSGEISIGGRVVNNLPPKERDIAMVFQNYALYPHMTVAANMGFSMRLRGAPKSEIDDRVNRAAEILGLKPLLERFPRQLSGGQRQRVAMGRAIVRDPQVFLFDEPLSNLDAKLRVQMRTEIKALHQRLKTTTIYVTHDQIEAMTMADKIVVMHDGLVEQIGAPLELYDRPANLFVAGFIGSPAMNFLKGTIRANGAASVSGAGGINLPLGDGAIGRRRPPRGVRHPARALRHRRRRRRSRGPGDRADRLGDPGGRPARRSGHHRGVPRAPPVQAGRYDPAEARRAARPSVRRGDRASGSDKANGGTTMTNFTRRALVQGGTALGAAGALTGPALLDWAKAWAQAAPWKPETGAQLSMLRWKYFVQAEDDEFVKLMEAFAKATGVKVNISRESYEDVQPKASVAANTGTGPDLFWGLYSLPHLFPQKCLDVTDVADYLGKKYGGWVERGEVRQERQQMDRHPDLLLGQHAELPGRGLDQGGLLEIPRQDRRLPRIRQGDEEEQHAGWLRARPRLWRWQWLDLLVPVGARRQHRRQERQGRHQLAGDREGAGICQGALRRT